MHSNFEDDSSSDEEAVDPDAPTAENISDVPVADQVPSGQGNQLCVVCRFAAPCRRVIVPCGHARFCAMCLDKVQRLEMNCPIVFTGFSGYKHLLITFQREKFT